MGLVGVSRADSRVRVGHSLAGQRESAPQTQDPRQRLGSVAEGGERAAVQAACSDAQFVGGRSDRAARGEDGDETAQFGVAGSRSFQGQRLQRHGRFGRGGDPVGQSPHLARRPQVRQLHASVAQFVGRHAEEGGRVTREEADARPGHRRAVG
jgi:hypothetical protein